MVDVIIIGAGTAGLSAAIYSERAGHHAVILEGNTFGGQIVNTPEVANYPGLKAVSGFDFAMGLYEQATALGAEIVFEKAVSLKKATDEGGGEAGRYFVINTEAGSEYQAKAVIIATGAKNRHLGLPNEEALTGKGISYCATCDGAFFKGRDVAVNGGGNTALEDAMFLTDYCSKVYIIHRRDAFRGEPSLLEMLKKKENVEFVLNSTVTALNESEEDGRKKLDSVEVTDKISGEKRNISVDALFVAIGQEPDNKAFEEYIELDKAGYGVADDSCHTKTPGIFIAGDCRTKKLRQLITAASDGAVAALEAVSYIQQTV